MLQRKLPHAIVVAIACLMAGSAFSQGPKIHIVAFDFYQQADDSAGLHYAVQISHATPLNATVVERKLISPGGTEFVSPAGSTFVGRFEHTAASFVDLAAFTFGDWTVIEKYDDVELNYQLRLAPFGLGDVFSDVPIITSPASGSNTPFEFLVDFEYMNGGAPSDTRWSDSGSSSNLQADMTATANPSQYRAKVSPIFQTLPLPDPKRLVLRVGSRSTLPDPEVLGSPQLPPDQFSYDVRFFTFSAPAEYTIVPEPSSHFLLLFVGICSTSVRRR